MNAKSAAERILALVLSVALVLTTTPVTALTAYAQNSGACAHVCGDGTCTYTYTEGADCDHDHDESCGVDEVDCAHDCNDGTCGYIAAAPCNHEHDGECGDRSPAGWRLTTPEEPDKDEPDEPELIENDLATPSNFVTVLGFSTPAETATVPLGTSYVDLPLPENLSATVEEETDPADVPVEWTDDDHFDGDTPDDYSFTGQLGAGYILAGGVNPPTFTVTVEADASVTTQIIVARFDALDEDVEWQGYDFGTVTSPAALTLPDTLHGTDADDNPIAIMGVTWQSEPEFTPEISQWYYFSPTLPQGYALAEAVKAPVISVFIRPEGGVIPTPRSSAAQLTDIINNFAPGGTGKLNATQSGNTVTVTGTVTDVNNNLFLNIDSGVTVVWRANYSGNPINNTLRVHGGGEFELAGGSIKRTGNNYALSSSVTNLTISGGTVSTSGIGAAIDINNGTLIMTGGTVESTHSYATAAAIRTSTSAMVAITGGTVRSSAVAFNNAGGTSAIAYRASTKASGTNTVSDGEGIIIEVTGASLDKSYIGTANGMTLTNGNPAATARWVNNDGKADIEVTFSGGATRIIPMQFTITGLIAQSITAATYSTGPYNVGNQITATPGTYTPNNGGNEGTHTYKWYRSDNSSGLNAAVISGAQALNYMPGAADFGKYICIETTPIGDGTLTGTPVKSAYIQIGVKITASANGADGASSITVNSTAGAAGIMVYDTTAVSVAVTKNTPTDIVAWSASLSGGSFGNAALDNTTYTPPAAPTGDIALTATLTVALPAIDGTLNALAVDAATGKLTATVSDGSGTYIYAWSVAGQGAALNGAVNDNEYTPAASELGKIITCTVTKAETTGELTKSEMVYKAEILLSGNATGDSASVTDAYGKVGDTISIAYTVGTTGTATNSVAFTGGSVTDSGSPAFYTIDASDAASGIITITATFTHTDTPPAAISIQAIDGITIPATGGTPVTAITDTAQYTGTVSWMPDDSIFAASTQYTAIITITPKAGYTLTGVGADFFTVADATSVTNSANSGTVTAVFPQTGSEPDTEPPTGEITVKTRGFTSFHNAITFGLFFKDTPSVTITASDNSNEAVTIKYILSATSMSKADLEEKPDGDWTAYSAFSITPGKYFIYAKLTDASGNSDIISTDGIVIYTDSEQDTANIGFTKGSGAGQTADVRLNGNTINKIMNGSVTLTENTDYAVSGGTITFKSTYLESLAAGSYTLTVYYNPQDVEYPTSPSTGSEAPATTTISLTVSGAAAYPIDFTTNGVTENGVTATGTISPSGDQTAGTSITVTVTLTGTATAAGTHTIGLTNGILSGGITPPPTATRAVTANENVTSNNTFIFTFTMPPNNVNDLVITHTFTPESPSSFSVNVANGSGGGNYAAGTMVTLTANTAPGGQQFKEWAISPAVTFTDGTSASSTTVKFVMPSQAVTATAAYEPIPAQTYAVNVTNGSGGGNFAVGATVSITANSAPSGKVFDKWTTTSADVTFANANSASTTFTMPPNAVIVAATYKGNGGGGSSSGSGGGGSSYTPATPTITTEKQPNMPTVTKYSVSGTVKDNVLSAAITEKMAKDAITAAGSNTNGIAVQFNITGSGDYVSLSATFERKALEALKAAGVKYVQIGSAVIDLTLDLKAIEAALGQTTGNVTVTAMTQSILSDAAKALIGNRPVFDITIKDGMGVTVSDLKGGTATIGIPYKPSGWEKTGSLYAVYVDSNGKPQVLTSSSYNNGKVIFSRSSLSVYGVGCKVPIQIWLEKQLQL